MKGTCNICKCQGVDIFEFTVNIDTTSTRIRVLFDICDSCIQQNKIIDVKLSTVKERHYYKGPSTKKQFTSYYPCKNNNDPLFPTRWDKKKIESFDTIISVESMAWGRKLGFRIIFLRPDYSTYWYFVVGEIFIQHKLEENILQIPLPYN